VFRFVVFLFLFQQQVVLDVGRFLEGRIEIVGDPVLGVASLADGDDHALPVGLPGDQNAVLGLAHVAGVLQGKFGIDEGMRRRGAGCSRLRRRGSGCCYRVVVVVVVVVAKDVAVAVVVAVRQRCSRWTERGEDPPELAIGIVIGIVVIVVLPRISSRKTTRKRCRFCCRCYCWCFTRTRTRTSTRTTRSRGCC